MNVSIPIKNGKGASRTSVIAIGRIGMSTCFQLKGNIKEIRATAACVSKALCSDMSSTFFSKSKARNISMTCSASKALNRYSISAFVA